MKSYTSKGLTDYERIYNYRLNRTRRASESAFDILVDIFCVLAKYGYIHLTNACIALHNFLLLKRDACFAAADNDQPQRMC